ncbi:MAG: 30S ribosomal protein S4 [Candidatus Riflebacteria bacterium]|nr:30S ribosomal protein S4 [Candidatus Riflebacteria bacterium]
MARYIGPVCRLCRREGEQLFLKGARCYSEKCAFKRRSFQPGQHGSSRMRKKETGYETQLRAKQKVKRTYGVLESQFRKYYEIASRKGGNSGVNLLHQLETRLDNVAYRMGFGISRAQTRMWVTQGHFEVNGRKCNIPSYQLKPNDQVKVAENSKLRTAIKDNLEMNSNREVSDWLSVDGDKLSGTFLALPEREKLDPTIQENLIIEFYSR